MTLYDKYNQAQIDKMLSVGALYNYDLKIAYATIDEIYLNIKLNFAYAYANELYGANLNIRNSLWHEAYDKIMNSSIDEIMVLIEEVYNGKVQE